jgi:hypothetical protein
VVIIGIVGLIIASQREQIDQRRGKVVAPANAADAAPLFARWLRSAGRWIGSTRQPVGRATPEEIMSRVSGGLKIALSLALVELVLGVATIRDGWGPVVFLIGIIPVTAVTFGISITHSIVLRMLPFRGAIVSSVLGASLAAITAALLRGWPEEFRVMLIPSGLIYGIAVGMREMALADDDAPAGDTDAGGASATAAPPTLDASSSAPRSP